ncbi:glycosyltransferase family 2 protein [Pseudomonas pergaminensis]|uniref:Glycosyltransferase family 2 protein n=1 Tax=Pseudomonas pergaminensis TaxID=2853159 RepID=A0ABW8R045_9PSED
MDHLQKQGDMKVAIICVCYNAYDHLLAYARSLETAISNAEGVEFSLVVVDNSTQLTGADTLSLISGMKFDYHYIKSGNVGYFPAFKKGVDFLPSLSDFDCVAVSNVDLSVSDDFFESLTVCLGELPDNVGIVAPAIISQERVADLNPKTLYRPTRLSLQKNIFIFKRLWLFRLYRKLSDLKARRPLIKYPEGMEFYSPHGSFIIFTRHYFLSGASYDYPQFLFGEEDFVAEECRRSGLKVSYQPSIKISDFDHGSTSREKLSFIANEHVKSIKYIVDTYHS